MTKCRELSKGAEKIFCFFELRPLVTAGGENTQRQKKKNKKTELVELLISFECDRKISHKGGSKNINT